MKHQRLKAARLQAGFDSASGAAQAYGWTVSTYLSHENGSREVHWDHIQRYARAYRADPVWILTGESGDRSGSLTPVPAPITAALGLPADATIEDVLRAIEALPAPPAAAAAPPVPPSASRPSAPDAATGLEPLHDSTLAEMVASMADAWEGADADGREDLRLRWQASFPDLARRALSLSRVLDYLGWRVVAGGAARARPRRGDRSSG